MRVCERRPYLFIPIKSMEKTISKTKRRLAFCLIIVGSIKGSDFIVLILIQPGGSWPHRASPTQDGWLFGHAQENTRVRCLGQRLCGHSRGEGRAKSADSAGGSAELPKRVGPGRAGHAAHKPKGHRGPTAQMRGADGTERDSEEAKPARATAPEPAERGSDEASESLGAAQDNRRVGKARQRVEEQRRREGRNRKSPVKGTEKPSYRSERDPAAPDMRRTSQRGTGAPWRRCGRTDGAERDSEEERPVPTTGPRFRTREPAPRPVPPAGARSRPEIRSGDLAGATEEAAARQTAKHKSFPAPDGKQPILKSRRPGPSGALPREEATIQNKPGEEHSQGLRTHSRQPKDGRGLFGPAQEDANRLCGQAMRPQARWLPMPHPEPTREKDIAATGARGARRSRAERLRVICYLSVSICFFKNEMCWKSLCFNGLPAHQAV